MIDFIDSAEDYIVDEEVNDIEDEIERVMYDDEDLDHIIGISDDDDEFYEDVEDELFEEDLEEDDIYEDINYY